mmetsp:Transcript_49471/g.107736  ORF Transcript_49471/g.107736 Transcript_49471/m.107736 type:complete len:182 (-) Transcript_49471:108-653(-)
MFFPGCPGLERPKVAAKSLLLPLTIVLAAGFSYSAVGRGTAFLTPQRALLSGSDSIQSQTLGDRALPAGWASGQEAGSSSRVFGASLAILAAAVVLRDVACYGAVPKHKRPLWQTRRAKVRWYKTGDRAAQKALELGRMIKSGTGDFIYGKPQDDDDYDEDDYDDDDFDDDDDDLEQKSLS